MGRCGRISVLPLKGLLLASGQLEERGDTFAGVYTHGSLRVQEKQTANTTTAGSDRQHA